MDGILFSPVFCARRIASYEAEFHVATRRAWFSLLEKRFFLSSLKQLCECEYNGFLISSFVNAGRINLKHLRCSCEDISVSNRATNWDSEMKLTYEVLQLSRCLPSFSILRVTFEASNGALACSIQGIEWRDNKIPCSYGKRQPVVPRSRTRISCKTKLLPIAVSGILWFSLQRRCCQ